MKDFMNTLRYADAAYKSRESNRLPNLNGMFNSHCLLSGRRRGVCDMLKGNVLVTFVLIDDRVSSWTSSDIDKFQKIQNNASRILEDQAKEYGTELSITTRFITCELSVEADSVDHSWMYAALDAVRLCRANATETLKNNGKFNEAPIIFALNKQGRGHADNRNDAFEYAVIYGFSDYRHELLHLFGAVDFYLPEAVSDFADKHFHNSIMLDSNNQNVDNLSAYLVGWTDKVSTDAYAFLNATTWITDEYLRSVNEKNSYTGFKAKTTADYMYVGSFKTGQFHGYGKIEWKKGGEYIGEWAYGLRNGSGVMHYVDGCIYYGEWEKDMWNGFGVCCYPWGAKYCGEWRKGKMNGKGSFYFADGSTYSGEWKEGKISGRGIYQSRFGDVYSGEWLNGKKNGYGTFYYSDGTKREGIWKNDEYMGNYDERLA